MSQSRRTIEQLIQQGRLSLTHADKAARHLHVYPTKPSWLNFLDKALLIVGAVALVLSLVFWVAYNWATMGHMGKFALVEAALVMTFGLYVLLSWRTRFYFIGQLLLLVASIITGSFLALIGQVYQTGADTWQLFAVWALLIVPWVIVARLPALWLLWLGLINVAVWLYFDVAGFGVVALFYQSLFYVGVLGLLNAAALLLWLTVPTDKRLGWSTYAVGLVSTGFITLLAILPVFEDYGIIANITALLLWAGWSYLMWWHFCQLRVDVLMLTYLCGSVIAVVMVWAGKLFNDLDAGGFLLLALLLIAMSSYAVNWLRGLARQPDTPLTNHEGARHD